MSQWHWNRIAYRPGRSRGPSWTWDPMTIVWIILIMACGFVWWSSYSGWVKTTPNQSKAQGVHYGVEFLFDRVLAP